MTTTAKIGYGCVLQRSDGGSPEQFVDLGELIDPGQHTKTRDAVEATHTASPGAYREFIGGLRDGGEFTATIALVPASTAFVALNTDFDSDTAQQYRFKFNDSAVTKWTFHAFITNIQDATPIDDRMTQAVTFKVTGRPVLG